MSTVAQKGTVHPGCITETRGAGCRLMLSLSSSSTSEEERQDIGTLMPGTRVTRQGTQQQVIRHMNSYKESSAFFNQLTQILINVNPKEKKRARDSGCTGHVEEKLGRGGG